MSDCTSEMKALFLTATDSHPSASPTCGVSCLRCVSICSLAFSMEGLYLSASSNTETVHIFKLETQKEKYVYVPFGLSY